MIDRIRSLLLSMALTRAILRLLPSGPKVVIRGYGSCRIPASIVPHIVDRIDARGVHKGGFDLRLDGGLLHDLSEGSNPGLSLRQLVGLYDAGDVGLESAALTFNGDVVIETSDPKLIERAQRRGAETGFAYGDAVMALASHAAAQSGRRLSGAY